MGVIKNPIYINGHENGVNLPTLVLKLAKKHAMTNFNEVRHRDRDVSSRSHHEKIAIASRKHRDRDVYLRGK